MEKMNENTSNHFIGYDKGILYSYKMENKTFLQKILRIGMKRCVDTYIENKIEREKARAVLEKGAPFGVIAEMRNYSNIDLFNLNRCLAAVALITLMINFLLFIPYLDSFSLFHNNVLSASIVAFIIMFSSIVIPLKFGDLQTKFLLNEFRKIDEITRIEELEELKNKMKIFNEKEKLKKEKLACNLYFKK